MSAAVDELPELVQEPSGDVVEVLVEIEGVYALLMHNGNLSDPLDLFAKAMKSLSAKRGKTDEDHENMAMVEWWGGLYLSEPATVDAGGLKATAPKGAKVIVPARVLTSALAAGARKLKLGKDVSAGVLVLDDAPLSYRGSKDPNVLARDPAARFRTSVKVGQSRVMRTRPRFENGWSLTFSVSVQPDIIDPSKIRECVEAAGKYVGIGDWRPGAPRGGPFGRFVVKGCA